MAERGIFKNGEACDRTSAAMLRDAQPWSRPRTMPAAQAGT
jgi:hypothetical protein